MDIQNLLSYFSEDAEIQTKIVHQLLFCLKNLEKYKITPNGLQSFMVILNIFHNNIEDELLSKLHQVALQVKRLKNPIYGILRSQYSLPSLSLEKSVFSSANVFFKENHVNSFAQTSDFIPAQFIVNPTFTGNEFLIRLPEAYTVKELLFAVDQNQVDKLKYKQKARIQVFAVQPQADGFAKKLIHDERVSSSTWHQVSIIAYDSEKYKFIT